MSSEVFKVPKAKRPHPKKTTEGWSPAKRRKVREKFLSFCDIVLSYTQYEHIKHEELRSHNNTSPLDSGGSTAESYTSESTGLSVDEDSSHGSGAFGGHNDSIVNLPRGPEAGLSDEDSPELVTCFCGKPFGGRPMIECSRCLTWIHLSCAKIRKNNIPEDFVCQLCKDSKTKKRKSGRKRFEKKLKDV